MTYTADELNQTGIYAIINLDNGKRYIGSAGKSFSHRWGNHKRLLRANKHHSIKLQNAWNKYTEFRFEFRILEVVPKEEFIDDSYLTDIEQMYLDTYQPEYNICKTAGSSKGFKHTEESRKRMSEAQKGKPGKKHNEESKLKIGLAHKGKKVSEETKLKVSQANTGKIPWNKGIPRSEDTKEKIRQSKLGRSSDTSHMLTKEVKEKAAKTRLSNLKESCLVSPDGITHTFKSIREFCRIWNLDQSCITKMLKGKQNQHKGWRVI